MNNNFEIRWLLQRNEKDQYQACATRLLYN